MEPDGVSSNEKLDVGSDKVSFTKVHDLREMEFIEFTVETQTFCATL